MGQYDPQQHYAFDETLKRLKISDTKLKRLVSEGEIRGFKDGEILYFRRDDVDNYDVGPRPGEGDDVIDLRRVSTGDGGDDEFDDDDVEFEFDDDDLEDADNARRLGEEFDQVTAKNNAVADQSPPPRPDIHPALLVVVSIAGATILIVLGYALGGGFK